MNGPRRTACFAKGMHNYTFSLWTVHTSHYVIYKLYKKSEPEVWTGSQNRKLYQKSEPNVKPEILPEVNTRIKPEVSTGNYSGVHTGSSTGIYWILLEVITRSHNRKLWPEVIWWTAHWNVFLIVPELGPEVQPEVEAEVQLEVVPEVQLEV